MKTIEIHDNAKIIEENEMESLMDRVKDSLNFLEEQGQLVQK